MKMEKKNYLMKKIKNKVKSFNYQVMELEKLYKAKFIYLKIYFYLIDNYYLIKYY